MRSTFRPAYDLLVRPPAAVSPQERQRGLISPNFGSGVFGGITFTQLTRIQHAAGVQVAAPVANIGYVLPSVDVVIPVNRY